MNKYTGEVGIKLDGKEYTVIYDLRALAAIQSKYGNDTIATLRAETITAMEMADILSIGLKRHHPEMTADVILDLSPPLIVMSDAVNLAIAYAWFGPTELDRIAQEMDADAEVKKKTH